MDRREADMKRLADAIDELQNALLQLGAEPATSIFVPDRSAAPLLAAVRPSMGYVDVARGHRTPDFIVTVNGVPIYSDRPRR